MLFKDVRCNFLIKICHMATNVLRPLTFDSALVPRILWVTYTELCWCELINREIWFSGIPTLCSFSVVIRSVWSLLEKLTELLLSHLTRIIWVADWIIKETWTSIHEHSLAFIELLFKEQENSFSKCIIQ